MLNAAGDLDGAQASALQSQNIGGPQSLLDINKYSAFLISLDLSFEEKLGFILAWELLNPSEHMMDVALNAHLKERATTIRYYMVNFQSQRIKTAQEQTPKTTFRVGQKQTTEAAIPLTESEYQSQRETLLARIKRDAKLVSTDPHAPANLELNGHRLAALEKRRPKS